MFIIWPETPIHSSKEIDKIEVFKSERRLVLISKGEEVKSYTISLGKQPIGHKEFEGDMKTPEGLYYIDSKNPNSKYYLNLGVSYPNEKDKAYARKMGKSPGGLIKIHGLRNDLGYIGRLHRFKDWTAGCIAVTNKEMKEIYDNVSVGTTIEIFK